MLQKMKVVMSLLGMLLSGSLFSQIVVTVSPDNCMAPTPNSGTYTQSGTMNGKPMYTKGANLRIIWTGTQWEIQGDDPAIGGVSWYAGWHNTNNTPTPPSGCWASIAGCFLPTLSGASVTPTVTVTSIAPSATNYSTATTLSYLATFSGNINGLSTSNFSVSSAGGISGASISSVNQVSGNTWNIQVNRGSGSGTISVVMNNASGASAIICSGLPFTSGVYGVNAALPASVTLAAGDVAFTHFNGDNIGGGATDDFSFVVLKSGGLPSGTRICFTDNGWDNTINGFRYGEGMVVWQATSNIPQFTKVKITNNNPTSAHTASTGTVTNIIGTSSSMAFATSGDQISAFQGDGATLTFLAAVHLNADNTTNGGVLTTLTAWDDMANGSSSARSAIPPGLTNGVNAVMVITGTTPGAFTEVDNAMYNCANSSNAVSLAALCAAINTADNWTKDDVNPFTSTPPSCTFSVQSGCTNPTVPTITATVNPVCAGSATTLSIATGSLNDATNWQWYSGSCGGTSVGSGTSIIVNPSVATTYYVRGEGGCVSPGACANIVININTASAAPTGISGTTTICAGASTTLTLTGGSAGTSAVAEWFEGSCGGTSIGTGNSIMVSPSATTTYFVRYNGTCNTTTCASVTVMVDVPSTAPTGISGNTNICGTGGSTVLSVVGGSVGTGAVAEWFTGTCGSSVVGTGTSITISPSATTTYFVRYNGTCNTTTCATATVQIVPAISSAAITKTNMTCHGVADGTVGVSASGGTMPYSYLWNSGQTTANVTGLPQSAYSVTVTDANGCTIKRSALVIAPSLITLSKSTVATSCAGMDGAATISATGGTGSKTFVWSNGATTATITGLAAGNYGVTATDDNGCERSMIVNVPNGCMMSINQTNLICNSVCEGSATVVMNGGGTAPYTYQWSNNTGGSTQQTVTGLCAGTYTVTVTDALGAVNVGTVSITQPAPFSTIITKSNATCNGVCDGAASVIATGSVAPYSYQWSNGSTTTNATGLCQGTHYVTVTSANGCFTIKSFLILQNVINLTGSSTPSSCAIDGTAGISVSGTGVAPYTYLWSNGETTPAITGLAAGLYRVTVTDANNCIRTANVGVANSCAMVVGGNENTSTTDATEWLGALENTVTLPNQINVYPNPNLGVFAVEVRLEQAQTANLRIQDVLGRTLQEHNLDGQSFLVMVDVSQWGSGAYFVQLVTREGRQTTRVIVTK